MVASRSLTQRVFFMPFLCSKGDRFIYALARQYLHLYPEVLQVDQTSRLWRIKNVITVDYGRWRRLEFDRSLEVIDNRLKVHNQRRRGRNPSDHSRRILLSTYSQLIGIKKGQDNSPEWHATLVK